MSDVTESPIDPKTTPSYRLALGAVILLGALIVIGVGILVFGLLKGWGGHAEAASGKAKAHVTMTIPPGYTILSTDTQPDRLILHIRSSEKDEILIIDLKDASIVGEINAEARK